MSAELSNEAKAALDILKSNAFKNLSKEAQLNKLDELARSLSKDAFWNL